MAKVCFFLVVLTGACAWVNAQQPQEDAKRFREDTRVIHSWEGEAAGDEFGWIARLVGDLDGDQVLDFVATAPSHQSGNGKIYVYSGKSGRLIFSHTGTNRERLGNGASAAGDVNGDSIPDVLVGAPNGPNGGAAYIYSGHEGKLIRKIAAPGGGGKFGYKTCSLGDIDGDLHSDVFVNAMTAPMVKRLTAGRACSEATRLALMPLASATSMETTTSIFY